jgi:peptidoglycan/LPS O-acetylase OafA/YrhL
MPGGIHGLPLRGIGHACSWGISALIMFFVFLVYRVTFTLGTDIPVLFKAGHALVFAGFGLTATFAFIALFQRFADSDAYLWRRLAANSYTIYFIHQCMIIPLAYTVQKIQFNIWMKYLGVSVTAVVLCFFIAEYVISPVLTKVIYKHCIGATSLQAK